MIYRYGLCVFSALGIFKIIYANFRRFILISQIFLLECSTLPSTTALSPTAALPVSTASASSIITSTAVETGWTTTTEPSLSTIHDLLLQVVQVITKQQEEKIRKFLIKYKNFLIK